MAVKNANKEQKVVRRYTIQYLLAMSLVAGAIVVGAFHTNQILELNRSQGDVVRAASEQYTLAQRLVLLPDRYAIETNVYKQSRTLAAMREAINDMRAGHEFIVNGKEGIAPPAQDSEVLSNLYGLGGQRLGRNVLRFIDAFEQYWANPTEQADAIELERVNAESFLLVSLARAAELHAQAAEDKIANAINVHRFWISIALALVALVIVFVFRPLAKHAGKAVGVMSAELDDGAILRARSFKIAKMGHWRITSAQPEQIWVSQELIDLLELEGNEGLRPAASLEAHYDDDDQERLSALLQSAWQTQEPVVARSKFNKTDKDVVELLLHMEPEFDATGQMIGLVGVIKDDTAEAQAGRALMESYELIESKSKDLIEAQRLGKLGTWRHSQGSDVAELDESALELLGLDKGAFVSTLSNIRACYVDDGAMRVIAMNKNVAESGKPQSVTVQARRGDGHVLDLLIRSKLEIDKDGNPIAVFGTMQDISKERAAARELEQLAYYDGLTGLANRTLFTRELARVSGAAVQGKQQAALLLIDLDHFKEVNDTLGHQAGDQLLGMIANRLLKTVPSSGFVARLGGDEFAVLLEEYDCEQDINALCDLIIENVSIPAKLSLGTVQTNASIGIALAPLHSCEPDELLSYADLALYSSKAQGRGRACYYDTSYSEALGTRMSLSMELRSALHDERFETHYQPIVDVHKGTVGGFEALLRLPRIGGGFIPPSEFIPIAESSHLIADLGALVLHEACKEAQNWIDAGLPTRTVSVNVSAAQVWHGDLEKVIDSALTNSGFDPQDLCIELTESVFVADGVERLHGILSRLKERGIQLALDDFGTGYSSLGYLNRLPFDKLKIDRMFVSNAHASAEKRKMLRGVISLAKGLDLKVTAEGVETQPELDLVRDLGCDEVQGWFFGKAEPGGQAAAEAARIDSLNELGSLECNAGPTSALRAVSS